MWKAIETDILVSIANFTTGPEARAAVVEFAAEKRDEIIARDQPSKVTTYVDGTLNAPLTNVRLPDGVIRFEFSYLREVVAEIYNMLIAASPYRTKRPGAQPPTHYKDEHVIFVNGIETDDITNIPVDATVSFVNLQPYARKIERGLSIQAPTGVYEVVASKVQRSNLGKVAIVKFTYDIFPHAGPQSLAGKRSNRDSKNRRDDRFPTITVTSRY